MGFLDSVSSNISKIGENFNSATSGVQVGWGPNGPSISGTLNNTIKKKMQFQNVDSPIKELFEPNGGKVHAPIVYPSDLDNDHYIMFHVMERRRPGINSAPTDRAIRSIVLPVPMNLSTSYGVNYENKGMGVLGGLASGQLTGQNLVEGGSSLLDMAKQKATDIAGALGFDISDDIGTQKSTGADTNLSSNQLLAGAGAAAGALVGSKFGAVGAALGGSVVGAGNIPAGIMMAAGKAINPHMAVLFNDVKFRNFQFQYRLMARNQEESDTIKELISVLKYHMHPALEDGTLTFGYPEEFEIEFSRTIAPYLFKINKSVLTDISVNYNGENMPLFFEQSQAPVSIDLTMSFQETKILTKQDFRSSASADYDDGDCN